MHLRQEVVVAMDSWVVLVQVLLPLPFSSARAWGSSKLCSMDISLVSVSGDRTGTAVMIMVGRWL